MNKRGDLTPDANQDTYRLPSYRNDFEIEEDGTKTGANASEETRRGNQSVNQSIFISPKIKRHLTLHLQLEV